MVALVATPRSRNSTAFWTAVVMVCMVQPRPMPNGKLNQAQLPEGVSTWRREKKEERHHLDRRTGNGKIL